MRIAKRSKGPVEKPDLLLTLRRGDAVLVSENRLAECVIPLGGDFTILVVLRLKIVFKINSSPLETGDHAAAAAKTKPSLFFACLVNPTLNQSSLEGSQFTEAKKRTKERSQRSIPTWG